MKYSIWCKLFGHKFMGNYIKEGGDWRNIVRVPQGFCDNCGLTKEQLAEANKINGSKGGHARAKKLTKKRRSEIALLGAIAKNNKV